MAGADVILMNGLGLEAPFAPALAQAEAHKADCSQGIALLAGSAAPLLTDAAVAEMSAVGGVLLIGLGLELLGARAQPLKIANMLPGVFLPVAYLPLSGWLSGLL